MAPWEQELDHYPTELDGEPAWVTVDLAARSHAPVASHPLLLTVRIPVAAPALDDPGTLPALEALAVEVGARLAALDPIHVGRVRHAETATLYFYLPEGTELTDALTEPPVGGAPASWRITDDADWERAAALAPDPLAAQLIGNRRLIHLFEERGDKLDLPRAVEHLAYFSTRRAAERAAIDLRAARFRVEDPDEVDDGEAWSLRFHREDALADGQADAFVAEIFAILGRHDGRYDGWGAEQRG